MESTEQAVVLECIRNAYGRIGYRSHVDVANRLIGIDPSIPANDARRYMRKQHVRNLDNLSIAAVRLLSEHRVAVLDIYRNSSDAATRNYLASIFDKYDARSSNRSEARPRNALNTDLPDLPSQGPGPHFQINEKGVIGLVPPEALDRDGNNIGRLRRLHPPICVLARKLVDDLGTGNAPHAHLATRVEAYRKRVDQNLDEIDFPLLYVEGVRLSNSEKATLEKIAEGELPPLTEKDHEAVETLLQLHGAFILGTVAGAELVAAEQQYRRRPSDEREYREAAVDFASSLQSKPNIIDPEAAEFVLGAAEQIGHGANLERSGVVASSTMQNVAITIAAAAAVAALPVMGGVIAGASGLVAGGLTGLLASESLKKSRPFAAVIAPIIANLDRAAEVDFQKFKRFLLSAEQKIRRLTKINEQFLWLNSALNWIKSPERSSSAKHEIAADREQPEIANGRKAEMLANMSHKLRTPLNGIIGFSQIIAGELLGPIGTPKYVEYARSSEIEAGLILNSLDDMGNLFNIETGNLEAYQLRLQNIIGLSQVIAGETLGTVSTAKYVDYARDILASGELLLRLLNDILDVSRLEAGKLDLAEEVIDPAKIIADLVQLDESKARAREIEVTIRRDGMIAPLRADARRLKQIVLNLLVNAINFSHPGGKVEVVLRNADGGLAIAVIDHGIGMDAAEIKLAMTRFGRAARTSYSHGGLGLGLPLAIGLTELHGGTLTIHSTGRLGTTVTVTFPRERSVEIS